MKNKVLIMLAVALLLPMSVFAATFQQEERAFISVPVLDDLYLAGGQINVTSVVKGDLAVAGGEIEITGDIEDDLFVGGGRIILDGTVGDDVRVAGGEIDIRGEIKDDLIVAGGSINIIKGAKIGGDLIVTGGEIRFNGEVAGNLLMAGGRTVMNGVILGNAEIKAGSVEINGEIKGASRIVADDILLGPSVKFGNPIEYWSGRGEVDFGDATAVFNKDLQWEQNGYHVDFDFGKLGTLLSTLAILSAILVIIFLNFGRKFFTKVATQFNSDMWRSFGIGILFFIATPFVVGLLMATVIGIPLGLLLMAIFGFSFMFAVPLTSVTIAAVWEKRKKGKKDWTKWQFFGASLLALLAIGICAFIPVIGWLIIVLAVIMSFGSIIYTKFKK